jgi:hypothetical protein
MLFIYSPYILLIKLKGCYINIDEFKSELMVSEKILSIKNNSPIDISQLKSNSLIYGNQSAY